jgi:hypothetical protein
VFAIGGAVPRPPVRALVPERDAARVRPGQAARVRFVADPDAVWAGTIARAGGGAGVGAGAVWVELDAAPARPPLHGQLAAVAVVVGRRPPALALPRAAVVADGAGAFVMVRKPDGAFDRRAVEAGPADDRFVTIARGLSEGEQVAVAGAAELLAAFAAVR